MIIMCKIVRSGWLFDFNGRSANGLQEQQQKYSELVVYILVSTSLSICFDRQRQLIHAICICYVAAHSCTRDWRSMEIKTVYNAVESLFAKYEMTIKYTHSFGVFDAADPVGSCSPYAIRYAEKMWPLWSEWRSASQIAKKKKQRHTGMANGMVVWLLLGGPAHTHAACDHSIRPSIQLIHSYFLESRLVYVECMMMHHRRSCGMELVGAIR